MACDEFDRCQKDQYWGERRDSGACLNDLIDKALGDQKRISEARQARLTLTAPLAFTADTAGIGLIQKQF